MKPLLICPPPFKDESFGGYILRLTELNLYPSPNYIYKWVRTNQRIAKNPYKINPKDTDIKNLAILLNSTENLLWSMLVPFYKTTVTNPKKIREKYMTSTFAKYFSLSNKVCVKCLVENLYIKKYWDIFMVTVCPEHLCYLVDECPKCKKKLKYNRKK